MTDSNKLQEPLEAELDKKITVEFDKDDWVWMCEFVLAVIKNEDELKPYEREDLARLHNVLTSAEKGFAK